MEYPGTLGYYNYHQQHPQHHNNYDVQHFCPDYRSSIIDTNFHNHSSHTTTPAAAFYQSPVKQAYPVDKNSSKYSTAPSASAAPVPDFNANVSATAASPPPPANANHAVKPAPTLPTFPWMNYSSEDGNIQTCTSTRLLTYTCVCCAIYLRTFRFRSSVHANVCLCFLINLVVVIPHGWVWVWGAEWEGDTVSVAKCCR